MDPKSTCVLTRTTGQATVPGDRSSRQQFSSLLITAVCTEDFVCPPACDIMPNRVNTLPKNPGAPQVCEVRKNDNVYDIRKSGRYSGGHDFVRVMSTSDVTRKVKSSISKVIIFITISPRLCIKIPSLHRSTWRFHVFPYIRAFPKAPPSTC